jgi:hypothetical protein
MQNYIGSPPPVIYIREQGEEILQVDHIPILAYLPCELLFCVQYEVATVF